MDLDDELLENRKDELEILQEIYPEELQVENDERNELQCISIVLHPATGDQHEQKWVCLDLLLKLSPKYPCVAPAIAVKNPRGLAEEHVQGLQRSLQEMAAEKCGECMLYELIEFAKESITEGNLPYGECVICKEDFSQNTSFTKTPCYHHFHCHCLARYIEHSEKEIEDESHQNMKISPHMTAPTRSVLCPVCREPITYDLASLRESATYDDITVADIQLSPDVLLLQQQMAELFQKQLKKGGIIDLKAEKNKYLISATPETVTQDNVGFLVESNGTRGTSNPAIATSDDIDKETLENPAGHSPRVVKSDSSSFSMDKHISADEFSLKNEVDSENKDHIGASYTQSGKNQEYGVHKDTHSVLDSAKGNHHKPRHKTPGYRSRFGGRSNLNVQAPLSSSISSSKYLLPVRDTKSSQTKSNFHYKGRRQGYNTSTKLADSTGNHGICTSDEKTYKGAPCSSEKPNDHVADDPASVKLIDKKEHGPKESLSEREEVSNELETPEAHLVPQRKGTRSNSYPFHLHKDEPQPDDLANQEEGKRINRYSSARYYRPRQSKPAVVRHKEYTCKQNGDFDFSYEVRKSNKDPIHQHGDKMPYRDRFHKSEMQRTKGDSVDDPEMKMPILDPVDKNDAKKPNIRTNTRYRHEDGRIKESPITHQKKISSHGHEDKKYVTPEYETPSSTRRSGFKNEYRRPVRNTDHKYLDKKITRDPVHRHDRSTWNKDPTDTSGTK